MPWGRANHGKIGTNLQLRHIRFEIDMKNQEIEHSI